ncbi:hypothetical protein DEIPH_ctg002orf0109 [Deinococcus phoenicis]|uniref:M-like protein n=1 Tax=Deinococcus phoenicis TaxID=1476583 RepID=A0A016QUV6_9DEIO|nr:hypothetical protein [Deinococcus phoenicis]EYB69776.1 hypothetical protein DEIPH_ctg002orf0109 [Deinococcus phoenicis]
MTKRDDQQSGPSDAAQTADQPTNVDLQFMGKRDWERDRDAKLEAQNRAPGEYEERGFDKQDVASKDSMITSDPASTTPGEETSLNTKEGGD